MTAALVPTIQQHNHLLSRVDRMEQRLQNADSLPAGCPEHWTRKQTARYLNLSTSSVDRMIKLGKLKAHRDGPAGGAVRILFASIQQHKLKSGVDREYLEQELKEFLNTDFYRADDGDDEA